MKNPPTDFGKRAVVRAGLWTLGGYSASMLLRLASTLVMTRLLAPEMFGLMSLAMVIIQGLSMLSDAGLAQIAVRSERFDSEGFRRSLWTVQLIRGALISMALVMFALLLLATRTPGAAANTVYQHPTFPYVLMGLALAPLLSGLEPVGMLDAARQMKTRVLVQIEVGTQLFGLACMIVHALISPSVWPLVTGVLASALARIVVTYRLFSGTGARLQLDREHLSEIIGFGKWITASSVIGFVALNGDRLVLGVLVPPALLGFYAIAHLLVTSLDQCLTKLINSVAFPVFADAYRTKPEKLREIYYRFQLPVAAAVAFIALFTAATAPLIIRVLYDPRYAYSAQVLSLLVLVLLAGPMRVALQLLMSMGNSRIIATAASARAVVSLLGIWVLYGPFGLPGVAAAAVLGALSVFPFVYRELHARRLLDWKKELVLLPCGALGLALGLGVMRLAGSGP